MRKPRKIVIAKETLRNLLAQTPVVGGGDTAFTCVCPPVGQHTCAYSNCGSCATH